MNRCRVNTSSTILLTVIAGLLSPLRSSVLSLPLSSCPFDFSVHRSCHPDEPDNARNDSIRDLAGASVVGQLKTKSTIDDAEGDQDSPKPEVSVRPDLSSLVFLEHDVMEDAENGLEEEQSEDDYANDWMVVGGAIAQLWWRLTYVSRSRCLVFRTMLKLPNFIVRTSQMPRAKAAIYSTYASNWNVA